MRLVLVVSVWAAGLFVFVLHALAARQVLGGDQGAGQGERLLGQVRLAAGRGRGHHLARVQQ